MNGESSCTRWIFTWELVWLCQAHVGQGHGLFSWLVFHFGPVWNILTTPEWISKKFLQTFMFSSGWILLTWLLLWCQPRVDICSFERKKKTIGLPFKFDTHSHAPCRLNCHNFKIPLLFMTCQCWVKILNSIWHFSFWLNAQKTNNIPTSLSFAFFLTISQLFVWVICSNDNYQGQQQSFHAKVIHIMSFRLFILDILFTPFLS